MFLYYSLECFVEELLCVHNYPPKFDLLEIKENFTKKILILRKAMFLMLDAFNIEYEVSENLWTSQIGIREH